MNIMIEYSYAFFENPYQNRRINKYHLVPHGLIIIIIAEFYLSRLYIL